MQFAERRDDVLFFPPREKASMTIALLVAADLFSAIQAQDLSEVRKLLAETPSLATSEAVSKALAVSTGEGFLPRRENRILDEILARKPQLTREQICALGSAEEVRAVLKADPHFVQTVAKNGWTPLHFAAFGDNGDAARALVDAGAAVNAKAQNKFANTPLQVAQLNRGRDVTRALIEKGADVNAAQSEGFTALDEAASSGDLESIRMLLAAGARKDEKAREVALKNKHAEAAALLAAQ
jgi:ankyrin repeat protein